MKTVSVKQHMESHASAFCHGNSQALAIIFEAWYPSLCDYIRSLVNDHSMAEEISSEAFVKTWQYRHHLLSADDIRAYLFTVARRDAVRLLQQQQKNRLVALPEDLPFSTAQSPEILQMELSDAISEAILSLPPRCRQVFKLLYMEGKDTNEVAKELVISPYTVRAQWARSIHLLRPKLITTLSEKA